MRHGRIRLYLGIVFVSVGVLVRFRSKSDSFVKMDPSQFLETDKTEIPFSAIRSQYSYVQSESAIDCRRLMEDDESEKMKAQSFMAAGYSAFLYQQNVDIRTDNCTEFLSRNGYVLESTEIEYNFPIAFVVLINDNVEQLEYLLRHIYRPQNVYCIHVDLKSPKSVHESVWKTIRCFDNVFITSKLVKVFYASFSRLQAEINCMSELLERREKWLYLINLASTMFPLKTNLEIVKILKIYNGRNDIEGAYPSKDVEMRYTYAYKIVKPLNGTYHRMRRIKRKQTPPPHEIRITKGSAYGVFSRAFIQFALTDNKSRDFLEWLRDTYSPDEQFWSSLHHIGDNPQFHSPGGYKGNPEKKPWLASYSAWSHKDKCNGKFVRDVCLFGIGDLPHLITRKEIFANKFSWDDDPIALHCLGEWIKWKVEHVPLLDEQYYKELPFVKEKY